MTNADRRLRGPLAGIFSSGRGREDFAEWDLDPGHILRTQRLEVGADKAAKEGSAYVVGMTL